MTIYGNYTNLPEVITKPKGEGAVVRVFHTIVVAEKVLPKSLETALLHAGGVAVYVTNFSI